MEFDHKKHWHRGTHHQAKEIFTPECWYTFFIVICVQSDENVLDDQLQQQDVEDEGARSVDGQSGGLLGEHCGICAAPTDFLSMRDFRMHHMTPCQGGRLSLKPYTM